MAEVLLQSAFNQAGLDVIVDSTGISDEEAGHPMDRRAVRVLAAHGIAAKPAHRARQITGTDLAETDLLIPMTANHARSLRRLAAAQNLNPDIKMMRWFDPILNSGMPDVAGKSVLDDFVFADSRLDVDDPWYGGMGEFENCLAELQAAVPGVVDYVRQQLESQAGK